MEWRCDWCGKPHEEDDPPCDNCGHGSFERAVVPRPDLAADVSNPDTTTVWVCTNCGREHPKHSPPCSRCNNAQLERQEKRIDESNLTAMPGKDEYETVSAESTTVWVCTECGREHPKHSPPCSRCGNAQLEPETKRVDDAELAVPSYLDLLTPKYLAALGVTTLLVVVFILGFTGMADVPGFPNDSFDGPDDVPGNAIEADGLSLADVEAAYLERLNDRRADNGVDSLTRTTGLDEIATAENQWTVVAALGETDNSDRDALLSALDSECGSQPSVLSVEEALPTDPTSDAVGQLLFDSVTIDDSVLVSDEVTQTGIDTHVVDDRLFLTQFVC